MADNNNFRRRNNNERHYSSDSHRDKNNNQKFNRSFNNSKPSHNYLFSSGTVLDLIKQLPLIKNQMRIEGVYKIFYGKEKSFDLKFPVRQFSLPGITPEQFTLDESEDSDSEDPKPKKGLKKTITNPKRRLSTIGMDNSGLVPDFDDIDEIHLDMNQIYMDEETSFTGINRQSRSFLRAARTSEGGGGDDYDDDEENEDDGQDSEDIDENQQYNATPNPVMYVCQNYMEYTQCDNHYLKLVANWKSEKEKYKYKYKKARKFLVEKFGGVARDTMNPFLQKKSDKNIAA